MGYKAKFLKIIKAVSLFFIEKIYYFIFLVFDFFKNNIILKNSFLRSSFKHISKTTKFQIFSAGYENFVLISNDFTISQEVYVNGEFGFSTFLKAKSILGIDFKINEFIDIGANIGTISIPVINRGYALKSYCFEPHPLNYNILNANIMINGLADKIFSYNLALGDVSDKELIFELSNNNSGDHRVRVDTSNGIYDEILRDTISVKSEKLDNMLPGIFDKNSTLIWLDTQGYEGYILKGAQKFLKQKIPLVVEFWPYGLERAGCYSEFKQSCLNYDFFYNLSELNPQKTTLNSETFDHLYNLYQNTEATDILLL